MYRQNPNICSDLIHIRNRRTRREKPPYIYGLRTRTECEPSSEHSAHSDRVTDIGSLLSFGTSPLPDKLNKKILKSVNLFAG